MNHYEELGVPRSASLADIRLAYKTLVRVLHPDQQQDEDLRRLSELQLVRLNHILAVLSDPGQRRLYDLSLDPPVPARYHDAPAPVKVSLSSIRSVRLHLRPNTGALVWLLIGAIALGSIVVWVRSPEPVYSRVTRSAPESPRVTPQTTTETTAAAKTPAHGSQTQADVPASRSAFRRNTAADSGVTRPQETPVEQKQSVSESAPAPLQPEPVKSAALVSAAPATIPETVKADDAPPVVAKPKSSSIAGKWLYVPKPDDNQNLYAAEYIELRIRSQAGLLKGRYRGKYRVPDRAISPEIAFQFEGKQGDSVSLLPWSSSNGSKGELRLKRLSDETIEVNWITTTFGNSNTLASGTAVLYRSDSP